MQYWATLEETSGKPLYTDRRKAMSRARTELVLRAQLCYRGLQQLGSSVLSKAFFPRNILERRVHRSGTDSRRGEGRESLISNRYTVTTRMISELRWAAM